MTSLGGVPSSLKSMKSFKPSKPKTVSENVGHARVIFTLDTYSHVLPSMREDSARGLEKILKS